MLCNLIDVNAKLPQVDLCHLNLLHQLLVRRGNIVERKDAPAETEEEQSAERNESPEGEHWDDFLLDEIRERNELEEESKVDRRDQEAERNSLLSAGHDGRREKKKERDEGD